MRGKCYLIGVYPPPYGGATVKCKLFCDTLKDAKISVEKIDAYEFKRNKILYRKLCESCAKKN